MTCSEQYENDYFTSYVDHTEVDCGYHAVDNRLFIIIMGVLHIRIDIKVR